MLYFFLLFLVLTFDTVNTLPKRDNSAAITPVVVQGKLLWEENDCIGCHTLLGEGAYFAPEPGRRSMPQFNFSDEELEALAEFLKYSSEIDTAGWPPNIQG